MDQVPRLLNDMMMADYYAARTFQPHRIDRTIKTPPWLYWESEECTEGNKSYTKRIRYSQLSCFFNFVRNNIASNNHCPGRIDLGDHRQPHG